MRKLFSAVSVLAVAGVLSVGALAPANAAVSASPAKSAVVAAPEAPSQCTGTVVRYGSRGDCVRILQISLNMVYQYGIAQDGIFGWGTHAAVRNYQSRRGLVVDGIVGAATWGDIVFCTSRYQNGAPGCP
ncbi:peptidoglycan-binding domain-containing protein [Cellulomonas sp. Root137]|uniref:peptidoglycan-binding domain-containing protein n=1 Tax=Cellulomonas sp. Root137 TaxID=1736459 RepID=UPI0006FF0B6C|nr:peptidoglycan-binding domain-containing protein [Cellulomonas sp. Root137]KQY44081.1 hypothetical protein ASD18_17260 [Cellulomonas sp. Root137]